VYIAVIMIVAGIVFSVLFFVMKFQEQKRRRLALSVVAERLRLDYQKESISGVCDNIPFSVDRVVRREGLGHGHRKVYTVFQHELADDAPLGLSIEAESTWDRVLERGIELGLPRLDDKFVVTGHNEDEVRNWARRPNVIEGLNRLLDLSDGSFKIVNGRLYVDVSGIEKEPELASYIEDLIRRLVSIVSCLSIKQLETTKRPVIDKDPADSGEFSENSW